MATNKREVELRAKFKDDASRGAKRVADALQRIGDDATKASQRVSKSGASFEKLTGDLSKLQTQSDKLKSFGVITEEFEKASRGVRNFEAAAKDTRREMDGYVQATAEAASRTDRLQQSLSRAEAASQGDAAALAKLKERLSRVNSEVREGEKAQNALNAARSKLTSGNVPSRGVGIESGAPTSSARASMGAFLENDLANARADQARLNEVVNEFSQTANKAKAELKPLRDELREAEKAQNNLEKATERAGNANLGAQADLAKARGELELIEQAAREGSSALGGLEANQEEVSRASARLAANLAATKARIEALSSTRTSGFDQLYGDEAGLEQQRRQVLEAKRAWAESQEEVKKLAQAMREAEAPTEELGAAFGEAQARANKAKGNYEQLAQQLHRVRGAAQSTFAEFSRNISMGSGARSAAMDASQLASATDRAASAQQRLQPAVQRTEQAFQGARASADGFSGALLGVGRNARQSLSYVERLRGEIIALTLSYVGFQEAFQQIGNAINSFRTLESVQSRLGAVFEQDTQRINQEVDFLRAQADRLGIAFSTLGDTYGKFAVASNAANFSQEATRDIFLAVAEAGRVNKLSLDQLKGTFTAIEQIISKGKFTSEEVRRQLGDRLAGAFNILADAMGVTTAELDDIMRKGELLATEGNLTKFADEMTRRFQPQLSSSLDTLSTDLGRFENNVFKSQLALAQGFIPGLRDALQAFDEFANSAEGNQTFQRLGAAVGRFLAVIAEVPNYFEEIILVAKTFIGLKLAGFLVNVGNRALELRGKFVTLGQEMAFIGPRMQQMSLAQRTLGQGFAQTIGVIDRYQVALSRSTASTFVARAGIIGLSASLRAVRGVMMVTANAARVMWSAIGGLPGIIATGITFAVGNWITSVDDATEALREHERQLQAVKEAYQETGGEVENFAKEVKGVTLAEAEGNLADLQQQYAKGIGQLTSQAKGLRDIVNRLNGPQREGLINANGQDFANEAKLLNNFLTALEDGAIGIEAFRNGIDEIYQSSDDANIRSLIQAFLEVTSSSEDGEQSLIALERALKDQRSVVDALNGDLSDFSETTEDLGEVVQKAFNFDEFNAALRKLKGEVSSFATEVEYLEEVDALNKMYQDAVKLAETMSQVNYLTDLYNSALEEIEGRKLYRLLNQGNSTTAGFVDRVVGVESGGDPTAKNDNSTATGLGQFIESTWLRMFKQYFPDRAKGMTDAAILALREQGDLSRDMVELYARENAAALRDAGNAINDATLYLAHFLGPGGANRLLGADPSTPVSEILGEDKISANESILRGKNAGEVLAWAEQKMGISRTELAIIEDINEAESDRLEELRKQQEATEERIRENQREIEQQRLINAGRERQAAIEEAVASAREDNPNIGPDQLARVREQAAAIFDLQNQRRELNLQEERTNQLYQVRQQLEEQLKIAKEEGNNEQVTALNTEMEEINLRLSEAITKTIAMWEAVGGPEAEAAIAKLRTMEMRTKDSGTEFTFLGLKANQVQSLVGNFATGMTNSLDSFVGKIFDGQNAIQSLWASFGKFAADFLRQIGMMIIKQQILNALQAMGGGGGGIGGAISKAATAILGHTGGVVGSSAIGSGNPIGRPAWAQSAFAYHSGGIAGLRPDEVSATLRKGEEILTEEDPRHRDNLGGEKRQGTGQRLKQVLAIGETEIANAMKGAPGEQVTLTHLERNKAKIRRMLGS